MTDDCSTDSRKLDGITGGNGIKTIDTILPNTSQVAVFDTAFHTTISQAAKIYPLPYQILRTKNTVI